MSEFLVNIHRHGIAGELVRVDQAAGELVVGVGGQPIIDEELGFRIECFRVTLDQAIDFRARGL